MNTRIEQPGTEAARGADVLVRRALRLLPGDRVDVLHHDSAVVEGLVRAAAARAGVRVEVHDLGPLVHETSAVRLRSTLRGLLQGATASVLLARGGLPQGVSVAVVRAAGELRTRHVHMPNVDPRALGSSVRADPDTLGAINARLVDRLGAGATVHVTSDAGTDLTVKLGPPYPLVADHGCPEPGKWDNLPAGFVYAHPLDVHGTLVADRIAHGSTVSRLGPSLRRKPLRVTFEGSRVVASTSDDDELHRAFEAYRASHVHAPRVGFVSIPTNPLARLEIGNLAHDGLLPGMRVFLGFSDSEATLAPFDLDHGFRLTGRGQTVRVGEEVVVESGRLTPALLQD